MRYQTVSTYRLKHHASKSDSGYGVGDVFTLYMASNRKHLTRLKQRSMWFAVFEFPAADDWAEPHRRLNIPRVPWLPNRVDGGES